MSPLPPERWTEVNRIFHNALAYPTDRRRDYVDDSCGTDDDLRDEVRSLLAYHERADAPGGSEEDTADASTAPEIDHASDVIIDPDRVLIQEFESDEGDALDAYQATAAGTETQAPTTGTASAAEATAAPPRAGLLAPMWWWQLSQVTVNVGYGIAAYFLWVVWQSTGVASDQWIWIGGLGIALLANTLRCHVWLTSRWSVDAWRAARQRLWSRVRLADALFLLVLLGSSLTHQAALPALAAALMGAAAMVLIAFGLIEPVLSRAVD